MLCSQATRRELLLGPLDWKFDFPQLKHIKEGRASKASNKKDFIPAPGDCWLSVQFHSSNDTTVQHRSALQMCVPILFTPGNNSGSVDKNCGVVEQLVYDTYRAKVILEVCPSVNATCFQCNLVRDGEGVQQTLGGSLCDASAAL